MMVVGAAAAESWLQQVLLADERLSDAVGGRVGTAPGLPSSGAKQLEEAMRRLFPQTPAIATYVPVGKWGEAQQGLQTETLVFGVFCCADNARHPGASLRGDERSIGAWQLVEHVRRACQNQAPNRNVSECTPLEWELLWGDEQLAVCVVHVRISIVLPASVARPESWTGATY